MSDNGRHVIRAGDGTLYAAWDGGFGVSHDDGATWDVRDIPAPPQGLYFEFDYGDVPRLYTGRGVYEYADGEWTAVPPDDTSR